MKNQVRILLGAAALAVLSYANDTYFAGVPIVAGSTSVAGTTSNSGSVAFTPLTVQPRNS